MRNVSGCSANGGLGSCPGASPHRMGCARRPCTNVDRVRGDGLVDGRAALLRRSDPMQAGMVDPGNRGDSCIISSTFNDFRATHACSKRAKRSDDSILLKSTRHQQIDRRRPKQLARHRETDGVPSRRPGNIDEYRSAVGALACYWNLTPLAMPGTTMYQVESETRASSSQRYSRAKPTILRPPATPWELRPISSAG